MKKYDLLRSGDAIIRVLEVQGDRVLVIDCIKRTMPVWVDAMELESYSECTSGELSQVTGTIPSDVDALDADQRKVMYERYTMIAPILSFVADGRMRSQQIVSAAEEYGVSKATVRNHLCLYLSYMDVTALAPKRREDERQLTQDEKNMRWALNKFFYTTKKQSLMTAYTMMLKEKYCDALGGLAEEYPAQPRAVVHQGQGADGIAAVQHRAEALGCFPAHLGFISRYFWSMWLSTCRENSSAAL